MQSLALKPRLKLKLEDLGVCKAWAQLLLRGRVPLVSPPGAGAVVAAARTRTPFKKINQDSVKCYYCHLLHSSLFWRDNPEFSFTPVNTLWTQGGQCQHLWLLS